MNENKQKEAEIGLLKNKQKILVMTHKKCYPLLSLNMPFQEAFWRVSRNLCLAHSFNTSILSHCIALQIICSGWIPQISHDNCAPEFVTGAADHPAALGLNRNSQA